MRQFDILRIDIPRLNNTRRLTLTSFGQNGNHQKEIMVLSSPPLKSFRLNLPVLFEDKPEGFSVLAHSTLDQSSSLYHSKIVDLVRTPDGRGLAIKRTDGGEVYSLNGDSFVLNHCWTGAHDVVVLDKGHAYVLYEEDPSSLIAYDRSGLAVCVFEIPPLRTLFSVPSGSRDSMILAVTQDFTLIQISTLNSQLSMLSSTRLSLPDIQHVLPVDPMAWATYPEIAYGEVLLCATSGGELSFCTPENDQQWIMTGSVHTGRRDIRLARCSSAKKTVLGKF